jgi:hypothetical protein
MGTGCGVHCKICGKQLYYGEDTGEIVNNLGVCHGCVVKDLISINNFSWAGTVGPYWVKAK